MARLSEAAAPSAPRRLLARAVVVAATALMTVLGAGPAPAQVLDTLLAQVDSRTVASSDVALARALGVFGFTPGSAPITRADVDRFVDLLLILAEAGRISIAVEPADIDRAWAAAAARAGGVEALERWLAGHAIDRDWARRFVEEDLVRAKYLEARFAAFVFADEEAVTRELGPGQHSETERDQARQSLIRAAAVKAQGEWLEGARRRASIRILLPAGGSVAPPFSPP